MDLRYIQTFYRAAMLKSVTAAAKDLRISQTTATKRIQVLENDLDTILLDRQDKRFRLTPAGARFLFQAKRLLDLWSELKVATGKGSLLSRPLRVGAIESVLHSWLVSWIEALRREQPALELELTVETTPALLDLLGRGTLDVAFATLPLHADGISTRELPAMPMVFAGNQALRRRGSYTLEQLARRELLTFQRNSQPYLSLLDRLRAAGLSHTRVHAISSISAMVRLAAGGFGIATLPEAALATLGPEAAICALRCSTELDRLPVHVSWVVDPASTAPDAIVESALASADCATHVPLQTRPSRKSLKR